MFDYRIIHGWNKWNQIPSISPNGSPTSPRCLHHRLNNRNRDCCSAATNRQTPTILRLRVLNPPRLKKSKKEFKEWLKHDHIQSKINYVKHHLGIWNFQNKLIIRKQRRIKQRIHKQREFNFIFSRETNLGHLDCIWSDNYKKCSPVGR